MAIGLTALLHPSLPRRLTRSGRGASRPVIDAILAAARGRPQTLVAKAETRRCATPDSSWSPTRNSPAARFVELTFIAESTLASLRRRPQAHCRRGRRPQRSAPIRPPLFSGSHAGNRVRTSPFASVGERSRETTIYQGIRCDSYNGVEVMRLCSNPSWPVDLG